jgi:hypothetical protein
MSHQDEYIKISDDNGQDYYCPLGVTADARHSQNKIGDDCVETDVVQRYSGNINVQRA